MKSLALLLVAFALVRTAPIHEPCKSSNVADVECADVVPLPQPILARETLSPRATKAPGKCAAKSTAPNAATVSLIKKFEGFVKAPAPDPIGLPTVGFGHLCKSKGCAEVPFKFPLTESTATQLLDSDAKTFVNCLHKMIKPSVTLNDNQFGALTSFAFNLGCGAVQTSTMLKRLNAGENPNTVAAQEIPKFNHAGGKVLQGLTNRRTAEVALFKKASSTVAHPIC